MGGSRAHGHARAHDARTGERGGVAIHAAAGGDEIVGVGRQEGTERNVVDMILGERVPLVAGGVVVQFDGPGGAADRVGEFHARVHFVYGQLVRTGDPSGLANPRKSERADA